MKDRQQDRSKWLAAQNRPEPKYYLPVLIVVLTVIYVVDEITSFIPQAMQSSIIFDLFGITSRDVTSPEYAAAMNRFAIVSALSIVFSLVAPFYKALADKMGRRPFLALNTCGMALGLLVIMTARHPLGYGLGYCITLFVIPNDVQIMYIMEAAPKQHRAKLCAITKAIALMSVSLIGVLRTVFMTDDLSSWRMVFLIPVCVAFAAGVASIFFVRETPVFIARRVQALGGAQEDSTAALRQQEKSGVLNAMRFVFSHRQHRWLAVCVFVFGLSVCATNYYETIMAANMSVADVSRAIIFFPFVNALVTLVSGLLADRLGRKPAALLLGGVAALGLTCFVLSVKFLWGAAVTGIAYGAFIGGLWSANDIICVIMPQESTPTEIRASVAGAIYLFSYLGMFLSTALVIVFQNMFDMGWLCLAIGLPFLFAGLVIMLTKLHETKGNDLSAVTGCEYDTVSQHEKD